MSVGAILAARRAGSGRVLTEVERRRKALDKLHVPEAANVWVYDQNEPHDPHKLRVPRAFRPGQEARGKVTREAVLHWLGNQLSRNVTDVGVVHEQCEGHPPVLAFFCDHAIEMEGSPFKEGTRLVVMCDGCSPDPATLVRIGLPPLEIREHRRRLSGPEIGRAHV
eukprot:TRINITY_DN35033_c0_g1_i2.p1 TRINITY_DN35033_c0_g1~~TRINITY_DN35033_c0_g1_i2.p1  ORF type:complete len:166 (+),score=27.26 TRINITY_DN35033_c0_g1_i2:28-525(+)